MHVHTPLQIMLVYRLVAYRTLPPFLLSLGTTKSVTVLFFTTWTTHQCQIVQHTGPTVYMTATSDLGYEREREKGGGDNRRRVSKITARKQVHVVRGHTCRWWV